MSRSPLLLSANVLVFSHLLVSLCNDTRLAHQSHERSVMSDITATLWFLVLAAAGTVTAEVFYFNEEMDGFFSQFRNDIIMANNSRFPLPNVHALYSKNILFFSFHGEMNGTEGTVRDMSTIKRTNNVTIVTAKEYFVFSAEFGFDELKVGYKYKARLLGVPLSGDIELAVKDNSIYVELLVNLTNNRCSGNVVTIRSLRFTRLDQITARVTGFSLVNSAVGYWLTHSLGDVSSSVTRPIEDGLRAFFRENIKQFDFCKFGSVPENLPFDDTVSSEDSSGTYVGPVNATSKEVNAVLN